MQKPEFLTKSRFKEGLDCITKLYYTGKKLEYANQKKKLYKLRHKKDLNSKNGKWASAILR
jgi:hypothetical protein